MKKKKKQQTANEKHVFLWFDLSYAAEMILVDKSYVLFYVYRIVHKVGHRVFYQFDGEDRDSQTTEMDKAVPFFEGRMDIIGCVEGEFNQEPMLVHFCSAEDVILFNQMTLRVYQSAKALLTQE
jgi:hypothetical protein